MPRGASSGKTDAAEGDAEISDEERDEIVDELVDDMAQLFRGYIRGALGFEDLTFEVYDSLRTLHALSTGDVVIEYEEIDDDEFDEFDDLAGEPTGNGGASGEPRQDSGGAPARPGHKPRGRN